MARDTHPLFTWFVQHWCLSLILNHVLYGYAVYTQSNLNDTCIQEKLETLQLDAGSQFRYLTEISKISHGKVLNYNADSGIAQLLLHREVGNLSTYQTDHYLQTVSVAINQNGDVVNSTIENEENVNGLLFQDEDGFGQSARLFVVKEKIARDEYNVEQYLTVVTKDSKTSCTLRLSQYNSHGRVLTDAIFGFFKFSPDGR